MVDSLMFSLLSKHSVFSARSELREILFLAPSVCFLFVYEISRELTAERICVKFRIQMEDVFGLSLGRV